MPLHYYELGSRPGVETLRKAGGLHKFMGWDRALLTDSGGFQMVSLLDLAEITEDGVKFRSPYDESECMLTPERSIEIQEGISMALKRVRRRTLKPKDHHGKRINNLWSFS